VKFQELREKIGDLLNKHVGRVQALRVAPTDGATICTTRSPALDRFLQQFAP
jgi:hypothetical protein